MPLSPKNLAFCLAPFVVALSACDGGHSPASNKSNAAPQPDTPPIALGKPGASPGVTVTISSVTQKNRIGTPGYGPKAEAGETFVVVRYTIKNTSTKPLSNSDRPSLELLDGDGQTYAEDTQAGILAAGLNDDIQDSIGDLNPKVTAKATAVWKVDQGSFDKKTWRLKASIGGLGASLDKAISWPMDAGTAVPLMFALK